MKKKVLTGLSYILVAALASAATWGVIWWQGEMSKLEQLKGLIDQCFIEEISVQKLEDAAAEAMIAATGDRWGYYIPLEEMEEHTESMENAYVGIGITITVAHDGDGLQIMSVNPGFGGQKFIESALRKVEELKAIKEECGYDFTIEIDGGINLNNVKTVTDAGVELVVAGSSVFGAEDIPARVAEFLEIL